MARLARRLPRRYHMLMLAGCFCLSLSAHAQHQGIGVHVASGSHADRLGIHWEVPLHQAEMGRTPYEITLESGLSRWRYRHHDVDDDAWQLSVVPFIRLWPTRAFYVEAGIGASLFSQTHLGDKDLGSAFQFCNHIGVGVRFRSDDHFNLRYSHFSNGGVVEPNDGLDVWQVTYTRLF